MTSKFRGVGVALVTPFLEDMSVDYDGLKRLLDHTITGGVDYLVVNGTTSEASTLTLEEKRDILAFIKANKPKQIPIMYGIGANNTQHVLDVIEATDFDGVDGLLTVSPYYNKPTQEGIYQHYKKVAEISPVPVMLYNVPGRTGLNMKAKTTLRLAELDNVMGIKEASGDMEQCIKIAQYMPEDFLLISGNDLLTIPLISIGGHGAISVLANAFPDAFTRAIHSALQGDYAEAMAIFKENNLIGMDSLMYKESNPVGVKELLRLMKLCEDHVRLPLVSASQSLQDEISIQLAKSFPPQTTDV